MGVKGYEGEPSQIHYNYDKVREPLKWKKPRRVFVNSMSDLFHESIDYGYINELFEVMRASYQHTFQI